MSDYLCAKFELGVNLFDNITVTVQGNKKVSPDDLTSNSGEADVTTTVIPPPVKAKSVTTSSNSTP